MLVGVSPLRCLALVVSLAAVGCHAQTAAQASASAPIQAGVKLSPEMTRRIDLMIRSRSDIPPDYEIAVGEPVKSDFPGYDQITITFNADGKPAKTIQFLLSKSVLPYELVVNDVKKDLVVGYLSVPKVQQTRSSSN